MGRKDQRLVRQRKNFVGDSVVLFASVATSKVATAGALNENRITRKHPVLRVERDAIRRMTRGMKDGQADIAHGEHLPVFHMQIDMRRGCTTMHDDGSTG